MKHLTQEFEKMKMANQNFSQSLQESQKQLVAGEEALQSVKHQWQ